MNEGDGIMQWMVEGALEYQKTGLAAPASVKEATEAYLNSEDGFGS